MLPDGTASWHTKFSTSASRRERRFRAWSTVYRRLSLPTEKITVKPGQRTRSRRYRTDAEMDDLRHQALHGLGETEVGSVLRGESRLPGTSEGKRHANRLGGTGLDDNVAQNRAPEQPMFGCSGSAARSERSGRRSLLECPLRNEPICTDNQRCPAEQPGELGPVAARAVAPKSVQEVQGLPELPGQMALKSDDRLDRLLVPVRRNRCGALPRRPQFGGKCCRLGPLLGDRPVVLYRPFGQALPNRRNRLDRVAAGTFREFLDGTQEAITGYRPVGRAGQRRGPRVAGATRPLGPAPTGSKPSWPNCAAARRFCPRCRTASNGSPSTRSATCSAV